MMIGRVASVTLALGFALTAASAGDEAARARGSWSINNWIPGDEVHLVLQQGTSRSRWQWGSTQHLADLKGLTREQLRATRAEVSFALERDAGVFFLTGTSKLGFASGEFHFVGSPDYAGKLAALGYETIGQDELLDMAIRDISLDFAAAVRTAGVNDAKVGDLARLRDHGVEVSFLRELASVGQPLDVDMVLELRDHGVDGRYVHELVAVGNPNVGIAHAVTLHDRGVMASFVKALADAGRNTLSVDEIVHLHDHGVDAAYVARVAAAGYAGLTVEQIVTLHDHGIN